MSYAGNCRSQWPARVREVVANIEPVNGSGGYPMGTVGGPSAPSCYRISLLSGSLEVAARLKSVDDLELLVGILEANRAALSKADCSVTDVLTLTQELEGIVPSETSGEATRLP